MELRISGRHAVEGAGERHGEISGGLLLRSREGKEEGDGADRRARTVSEGVGERSAGARRAGGGRPAAWAVRSWVAGACAGRAGRPSGVASWAQERSLGCLRLGQPGGESGLGPVAKFWAGLV